MLTSSGEVLECREREKYAVKNVWVLGLATFANSHTHKIIVPKARFHAESIGTSPVRIACKMTKLFKFLQGPTQRERTIVAMYVCACSIHTQCWGHSSPVRSLI